MNQPDTTLSALGELLEQHRGGELSKREAARRAGISEGRWRQIVTGQQKAGGGIIVPVNPKRETVIAMARAVDADVNDALSRAGFTSLDVPGQSEQSSEPLGEVERAILNDTTLIDEARGHLLNQYQLLRRLSVPAASNEEPRPVTPAEQRPLRAVARKRPPRHSG